MKETEEIIDTNLDFLPLKSYANIVEGNSLRIDWESVVPKEKLSYIMGNPPFVGYSLQSKVNPIITQWTCAFRLASLSQRNVRYAKSI